MLGKVIQLYMYIYLYKVIPVIHVHISALFQIIFLIGYYIISSRVPRTI